MKRIVCLVLLLMVSLPLAAQQAPNAANLVGTWELVALRDVKNGKTERIEGTTWMQFTKSHWTLLSMDAGRKVISYAVFCLKKKKENAKNTIHQTHSKH